MKNKRLVIIALFFTLVFSSFSSFLFGGTASAATPSFLLDTKKLYTYSAYHKNNSRDKEYFTAYFIGKMNNGDLWTYQGIGFFSNQIFKQDSQGLKIEDLLDNLSVIEIAFPLTVGTKWKSGDSTYTLLSVNQTVKTPAGTFKCIVIDNGTGDGISYYAPGVGLVKYEHNTGDITELTSIKTSHYGRVLIKQNGTKLYSPKGAVHRTLKKGEGLKVFKENSSSFDVGGGYYVKKDKNTLFYTGFIYGTEGPISVYSPNGTLFKKIPIHEAIRVYNFNNGKFEVGGGYYVPADGHILYER
ncbi:hypothetical protein [Metabacillus fastidiosus]|uniref:hypothetical protein n=1 Tax=Metabacillus fastidiosus TaxID=1458 RepID=UPI002DBB3A75|nr:hypothetical protein [Metabacillus fastidiosus]MEC2075750.1 hypothetical protein [Metabacillus fastidiosus]